jgi:hypothetical protein
MIKTIRIMATQKENNARFGERFVPLREHSEIQGEITYLFTPWSRVLLEKLTGFAASQEIPRIYGIRKFITVPTSARHLSLS